eukprot:Plantae.Rhodophyta-Hildenbrandia_rubra.ctg1783.p1 GENE.Plantae.Rhodophyta-Hildenbrandia_rubra.ctg1783~~Plantae.Rhodophyta-Hildenbrandia_rubra.ctg1783.p1  ORF type:complete len:346 (-),score=70.47 Plantae.Rhodophyta-Hildenbrandia_rubra.ctg1783:797-1834(-)
MAPLTRPEVKTIPGRLKNGNLVRSITIRSSDGHTATILTYGLRLIHLSAPDGPNIVLSLDNIKSIDNDKAYVGAIVGRTANRVRAGSEGIGRVDSSLVLNEAESHHIHGGLVGWSSRIWWVREAHGDWAEFGLICPDGGQGYSGTVEARVKFWIKKGALSVRIWLKNLGDAAGVTKAVVNPTLHPYFDLSGKGGKVEKEALKWKMWTKCSRKLRVDEKGVPTGDIDDVDGTGFDFTKRKAIEYGYDCFYVVDDADEGEEGSMRKVAEITTEDGKAKLELITDQPGFQFYTANGFDGLNREGHCKCGSFSLEPSGFIDASNHPHFPSIVLDVEEVRKCHFTYKFST